MPILTFESPMPVSAQALFDWHERPGAFMRLAPPWAPVTLASFEGIRNGQRAVIKLGPPPVQVRWVAEHQHYEAGRQFQDVQVEGPFKRWVHTHRMTPSGPDRSLLTDEIDFAPPLGRVGLLFGGALLRKQLTAQFAYRHRLTHADLLAHQRFNPKGRRLRIAMTGASGLLGSRLESMLATGGHRVYRLVRRPIRNDDEIYWQPTQNEIDAEALEGLDAVVHLAGENPAAWRWSEEKRRRIFESRVMGTTLLARTLAGLRRPPEVFVSASGISIYGTPGEEPVTEESPVGAPDAAFLTHVALQWEKATLAAQEAGIRTVLARIGLVLTPEGGALARMLLPFRLGLGGRIGSGRQYLSWISLDDTLDALYHALLNPSLHGPVNVVSPTPVTMRTFAKTLGRVLRRPALLPVPAAPLRLAMGDVADETILTSLRVHPHRLILADHPFRHDTLEPALRHLLGKTTEMP